MRLMFGLTMTIVVGGLAYLNRHRGMRTERTPLSRPLD
jgi:hypothetical protein